ncbi:hypothetical protein IFM89_000604 [Coptis chinensis]|uniref:Uncharacterized protein n=1 Tax=Coptis chinensis TaxID=261450 RepID=A0A835H906_9MAGN|nr:hypothetical protein IFM89_000604 [Coptis chinensis]
MSCLLLFWFMEFLDLILGGLLYFAGVEKKDERVLVPDLGSLTSIHDRHATLAFKGYDDTSEDWVLNIPSLSGAFNGTTRTYLDGMQ